MQDKIKQAIDEAIDEMNMTLPPDKRIDKQDESPLFGMNGPIDSLGLTVFIVNLEQKIEQYTGQYVTLVDQTAVSEDNSPFRTIAVLKEHLQGLIVAA
jgi:acyl carrier protein